MIEGRRDHGAGWVAPHAELEPSSTNPSHVPAWTMRHKCPKTAKVLRREKAAAEKDAAAKAAANSFAAANKYMRRGVHSSTLSATPSLASRRSSNVATPRGKRGSLPLGSLLRAASGASALSSRSRSRLGRNSTRGSVTFADVSLSTSSRYSSRGDDSGELSTIVEASASKPPSTSSDAKAPLSRRRRSPRALGRETEARSNSRSPSSPRRRVSRRCRSTRRVQMFTQCIQKSLAKRSRTKHPMATPWHSSPLLNVLVIRSGNPSSAEP